MLDYSLGQTTDTQMMIHCSLCSPQLLTRLTSLISLVSTTVPGNITLYILKYDHDHMSMLSMMRDIIIVLVLFNNE